MSVIESTLLSFFITYPEKSILIAYSGGIDSQVLLHAISQLSSQNKLNNQVSVCHVNHGLSANAIDWENFAEQQCKLKNVPLTIERIEVENKPQHSLEALARDARYDAIKRISTKHTLVVTGHHSDDQAETFLLAVKRGSGLKGLSSMKLKISLGHALLVRPLLNISRAQIEQYAEDNKLDWIEDESNDDKRFDRNFIRHEVMPTIVQRWPSFLSTLNRSTEHCQEGVLLLTELAEQDLVRCIDNEHRLSVITIMTLSQARFNNLIRHFLEINQCLMPSTSQLSQLFNQLTADEDKTPAVKVGDHWIRRYKGNLYLTPELKDVLSFEYSYLFTDYNKNIEQVQLPENLGCINLDVSVDGFKKEREDEEVNIFNVVAPKLGQQIRVSFKHHNPTCLPDYRQKSRALKKVLQELGIPTWQRQRIPFIYYDNELVAAVGYFVCKQFVAKKSEDTITISW